MTAVTLPADFEDWALAEVAAGHADSVQQFTAKILSKHRMGVEKLRASLDAAVAESNEKGWIDGDVVFAELAALLADEE